MTVDEELKQVEANAADIPTPNRSRAKKPDSKIEKSLALAADTQYRNGIAMVEAIGQQSFYRGIEDAIAKLVHSSDLSDQQLDAIATKFQQEASNRLQSTEVLALPASVWLDD